MSISSLLKKISLNQKSFINQNLFTQSLNKNNVQLTYSNNLVGEDLGWRGQYEPMCAHSLVPTCHHHHSPPPPPHHHGSHHPHCSPPPPPHRHCCHHHHCPPPHYGNEYLPQPQTIIEYGIYHLNRRKKN
ncbi:hypothetical protein ACTFIY_012458 [Dictyostelium cf. discoideum]